MQENLIKCISKINNIDPIISSLITNYLALFQYQLTMQKLAKYQDQIINLLQVAHQFEEFANMLQYIYKNCEAFCGNLSEETFDKNLHRQFKFLKREKILELGENIFFDLKKVIIQIQEIKNKIVQVIKPVQKKLTELQYQYFNQMTIFRISQNQLESIYQLYKNQTFLLKQFESKLDQLRKEKQMKYPIYNLNQFLSPQRLQSMEVIVKMQKDINVVDNNIKYYEKLIEIQQLKLQSNITLFDERLIQLKKIDLPNLKCLNYLDNRKAQKSINNYHNKSSAVLNPYPKQKKLDNEILKNYWDEELSCATVQSKVSASIDKKNTSKVCSQKLEEIEINDRYHYELQHQILKMNDL